MENFVKKVDDEGRVYIEFMEDPTKCRGGGLHAKKKRYRNKKDLAGKGLIPF